MLSDADVLRTDKIKQFYNSLTLLGEYYNRCRINNGPVGVLGCALFELLQKQLETLTQKSLLDASFMIDEEFAKLILTQVTLNGLLAQPTHKTEIDALLFAIRKCLIEVSQLSSNVKALFLMTLDLYYSKFSNIGKELENMYAKFLIDDSSATENHMDAKQSTSTSEVNSFNKLRSELKGLGGGRNKQEVRINNEYIGRPLKASQRLIYAQQQAATLKNKDETEEILQEKLFEKEMQDRNNENLKITEQPTSSECQEAEHVDRSELSPNKPNEEHQSATTAKTRSPKERKEDQAYFLVKPSNVRQRLKAPEPQPVVIGLTDWYAEVENSAQNQISPGSVNSDSTKRLQNGFHSNSSNPTSPNEIRRSNQMNHSFRSIRSDYSTRSMDRVGNPRYDYKNYDNKRHYNRGHYNHNNGGNYNNNFHNNRNNYQPNQGQYQDQHQNRYQNRRQNSDKGQNYANKKNDNRSGGGGGDNRGGNRGGYNSNNQYQQNRSYTSKSYGNKNRRQSYQHDDRSITPKPFEGEKWEDN